MVSERKNLQQNFEAGRNQAVQQLYQDVAEAFYTLLIYQSDISQYRDQIKSTGTRKEELKAAKRSGRARDSDILSVDANIATLEANISRSEGLMVIYRETFSYLTGLSEEIILKDDHSLPAKFAPLESWMEHSMDRPDIQQATMELNASEFGIRSARSGYFPTLGLSANYYLSRPTGIYQGVDWDTNLTLNFPFFSGGITRAEVSEAAAIRNGKQLLLQQTIDLASQRIRTLYGLVKSDFDQLAKLRNASLISQRSYELIHHDNRIGINTNTDVLIALQQWQESKRNFERTRITATYDYTRLLVESSRRILYE